LVKIKRWSALEDHIQPTNLANQTTYSNSFSFHVSTTDGQARTGTLHTPHGYIDTPTFMPAATKGIVKTLMPSEASQLGVSMLLANTYHLCLRPGIDSVTDMGGIHDFMKWDKPILTDSGGFQAFSLGSLRQIQDDGIWFQSHIDGSRIFFSPEIATSYQVSLGADIIMCLDQCIAFGEPKKAVKEAMERSYKWAERCKSTFSNKKQSLFGIVQGGIYPDIREESTIRTTSLNFEGYAIGGLAVGESKSAMYSTISSTTAALPLDKPRYLMGVGAPEDLVQAVDRGVDLFDCALPTRVARNGSLFTNTGRINITNTRYRNLNAPIDEECSCTLCSEFTASYLHHLFRIRETLGLRLATIHNLNFIMVLMKSIRDAISNKTFTSFKNSFTTNYKPTDEAVRIAQKQRWIKSKGI